MKPVGLRQLPTDPLRGPKKNLWSQEWRCENSCYLEGAFLSCPSEALTEPSRGSGAAAAASGSLMSLASLGFFNERVDLEKVEGDQLTPL